MFFPPKSCFEIPPPSSEYSLDLIKIFLCRLVQKKKRNAFKRRLGKITHVEFQPFSFNHFGDDLLRSRVKVSIQQAPEEKRLG